MFLLINSGLLSSGCSAPGFWGCRDLAALSEPKCANFQPELLFSWFLREQNPPGARKKKTQTKSKPNISKLLRARYRPWHPPHPPSPCSGERSNTISSPHLPPSSQSFPLIYGTSRFANYFNHYYSSFLFFPPTPQYFVLGLSITLIAVYNLSSSLA